MYRLGETIRGRRAIINVRTAQMTLSAAGEVPYASEPGLEDGAMYRPRMRVAMSSRFVATQSKARDQKLHQTSNIS